MPPKRARTSAKKSDDQPAPVRTDALAPTLGLAEQIYGQLARGEIPRMRLPRTVVEGAEAAADEAARAPPSEEAEVDYDAAEASAAARDDD